MMFIIGESCNQGVTSLESHSLRLPADSERYQTFQSSTPEKMRGQSSHHAMRNGYKRDT